MSASTQQILANMLVRVGHKNVFRWVSSFNVMRSILNQSARVFYPVPAKTELRRESLQTRNGPLEVIRIGDASARRKLVYFHGGGYTCGSIHTHGRLAAILARLGNLEMIFPEYRLAPEHPAPAAYEDAMELYQSLDHDQHAIFIGGDSAGAGISLALLAGLIQHGGPLPLATISMSGGFDWDDKFDGNIRNEMMLTKQFIERCYRAIAPERGDYRISPIKGEFRGATPVLLQVSDDEMLTEHSYKMHEHLQAQGVDAVLSVAHNVHHVWQLGVGRTPEADDAIEEIIRFIERHDRPQEVELRDMQHKSPLQSTA